MRPPCGLGVIQEDEQPFLDVIAEVGRLIIEEAEVNELPASGVEEQQGVKGKPLIMIFVYAACLTVLTVHVV